MIDFQTLQTQTLAFRARAAGLLQGFAGREDEMPPTWNNNARWHAGHLVVTPRLITFGLLGEPLGIDENYRKWFAKGTGPRDWGSDPVPPFAQLLDELQTDIKKIFEAFAGREDTAFPKAYETTAGVTLRTAAGGLNFSAVHDGIHMGMLFPLKRALGI